MSSVARLLVSWLAAIGMIACNTAHTNTSTETGNPPVIDLDKVSLVVSTDGVRIVGEPGAVTPGGAKVELEVVGAGEITEGTSNPDGSFDIELDTSSDAVVEVRATDGDKRSKSIYVTRGGASVGNDAGGSLSCMQRSQLASQAVGSAATSADISCQVAADCEQVSTRTVCTDSCGDSLVSTRGVGEIKDAVNAINDGLCASFAADGCNVLALPCPTPPDGSIACIDGKCALQIEQELVCPSCLDRSVEWGPTSNRWQYRVSGCEDFGTTREGQADCNGEVAHCGGSSGATIEALIRALDDADVEQAIADGGIIGDLIVPGGMSTRIRIDGREFIVALCAGPSCAVPAGVTALVELLNQIASDTVCEQPTCPPNARFVEDVCVSCGLAGGCGQTEGRCAVVCSGPSTCPTDPPGTSCSARDICEVVACF